MDRQAAALEGRQVSDSGTLTAESAAALLDRVINLDMMIIGPALPDVAVRCREVEETQAERVRSVILPSEHRGRLERRSFELAWSDGEIDFRRSRCRVPALDYA
jgi:hypothetical protein